MPTRFLGKHVSKFVCVYVTVPARFSVVPARFLRLANPLTLFFFGHHYVSELDRGTEKFKICTVNFDYVVS